MAAVGTDGTTWEITTSANVIVGSTVGVLGTVVPAPGPSTGALDLAGNPVIPTSKTAAPDTVNPFMQSAKVTNTNTVQAVYQNTYVRFTAVKSGVADGALGNAYSWVFVDVPGVTTPTFTGPSSTGVITVRGDFVEAAGSPAVTTASFTAAWNSSALASRFTVGALSGPSMNLPADIAAPSTNGVTTSTIVVQFNEGVQLVANGDIEVYASNSAGATPIATATTTPATAIDGKVTMATPAIINPLAVPVPGVAAVATTAAGLIQDLAGNPTKAQTLLTSAA